MPKQPAGGKKSYELRIKVNEVQYQQVLEEIKKFNNDPALLLQFLLKRYLSKEGVDGIA